MEFYNVMSNSHLKPVYWNWFKFNFDLNFLKISV